MPVLPFVTLDVFTQERYKGNPLGLVQVPVGKAITDEQMQTIAREFNLSETIFIRQRQDGTDGVSEWRVRIFLTNAEVPFAGHPTIGAVVYALGTLAGGASRGRLLANAGPIEVDFANGVATASIPHNVHIHTQYRFTVDQVHGLQPALKGPLRSEDAIAVVSPVKGMNFVTVELPDLESLAKVTSSAKPAPKLDEADGWNVGFSGSYFYVVAEPGLDTSHVKLQARMIEGSFEDPATGSAACALACYLALKRAQHRTITFEITQGLEMGRKSEIGVTVTLMENLKSVEKVELSGSAVKVMEGQIEV
ncbi:hypothetical protein CLAFUW4_09461 [Fulvia fulva]|uniref:Uncharacterized protein n=1 Tax=Passalora fulva TaxID=5499 RepID=A0A9Q8UTI5_PASFU|nr:uncharacterized protein CLAFUR5_09558 [Fulvia fulva]KAK4613319.1 hypothetical protein CLAFUR4_09467 [Fulvia fulva]UJO21822.1 hypothetical protein CLAFUR5_09558 [Fulvia fulva]WPV20365.1 hypothetical protein CLAFUW4_09461 [Fulvia fulva]WPV34858.1 hypothetical protein CLAFUW7_09462 [Fulvia fulva]